MTTGITEVARVGRTLQVPQMRRKGARGASTVAGIFGQDAQPRDRQLLKDFRQLLGRDADVLMLYDTSVNSFNAASFHQLCNNKGPTVSIARLADGTICGGYTEQPWVSSGGYKQDPQAFIFRLRFRGSPAPYKATSTGNSQACHDNGNYGPCFGGGHDLLMWTSNAANGTVNPHSAYTYPPDPSTGGSHAISGGYPNLSGTGAYQVWVYQVLPTNARTPVTGAKYCKTDLPPILYTDSIQCTPETLTATRDKLQATVSAAASPPNILLFGPVGSGKSSLVRSLMEVMSADEDAGGLVPIGTGEGSLSKTLMPYDLEISNADGHVVVAQLWDTAGIEVGSKSRLYKDGGLLRLLQGHFPARTNLMANLDDRTSGYRPMPTEAQQFHGAIMCIAATDVSDEDKTQSIKEFNQTLRDRGIPSLLAITKVDAYDPDLLDGGLCEPDEEGQQPGPPLDMRMLNRSATIKELLADAEKTTGFAKADMAAIANKTGETGMIGVPKACHLAQMLLKSIKRANQYRRQEAKFNGTLHSAGGPAPSIAPSSFVGVSVSPSVVDVSEGVGALNVGASRPSTAGGSGRRSTIVEALAMICQELAVTGPPDSDLKTALHEANQALGLEASGSLPTQVKALLVELHIQAPGW